MDQEAETRDGEQVSPILRPIRTERDQWHNLLELQQRNMMELMKSFLDPNLRKVKVTLPEYNPDNPGDADAQAWCNTVDICLKENPLSGSQLIMLLSKALKGSAAAWLARNSHPNVTWLELKSLFLSRFDTIETPAATLYNILSSNPNDGENMSTYVSRILNTLTTRWQNMTMEQVAISVALAHAARSDSQVQRMAFTTEIKSRIQLQRELMPFVYRKRQLPPAEKSNPLGDPKKPRLEPPRRCYNCGKQGHIANNCQGNTSKDQNSFSSTSRFQSTASNSQQRKEPRTIICFRCSEPGHIAPRCPHKEKKTEDREEPAVERRVNICAIKPATDHLFNLGEKFSFCFDSGSECSLIRETVANFFPGKRNYDSVTLLGIGKSSLCCNTQIMATVTLQNYPVELLFHVVPDASLSNDILIGRDFVNLGFSVEVSQSNLTIHKTQLIAKCDIGEKVKKFNDINTDVAANSFDELKRVLENYSHSFVEGVPISKVNTGQLELKLIDPSKTVQRRPYRMSPNERELVRQKVKELLDAGVIRESCSPFASPILLVKKKDGSDRLCVDYRELNNNTIPDRHPLPLIGDQIQRLVGANYFTSLDMASGFYQIPVHPNSIEITAFVTPDGQFEYLVMPFGLRNAPAVYQRAINKALGNLSETFAICYMDDIIIPSQTIEEGIQRLNSVLETLTKAGFSLNIKKCAFLKTNIEYLGYQVSSGQVRPNSRKINALSQLPPPRTVTQLRQFIGLASYFRQFIPGFSQITAPLYRHTSGKGNIKWTPEFENIRQKIITILTNEPVLTIFDPDCATELHTDASSEGYGAILMQRKNGKLHVVEYYSRRTTSCESKYHSYELETLAVVNAIKHFKHYLQGRKFVVVTDCNAVKASKSKTDLTPRVHRWWCFLQSFDFDIEYRPGKRMEHVDFLSRNPLPQTQKSKIIQKQVNLTEISDNWFQAEQQKDPEIKSITSNLQNNTLDPNIAGTYEIRRGILHRKIERNSRSIWLPIVPRPFQWAVINHIHESIMHLGWEKTLEKAYCHYWFPHMNKYVRKFVENCITCRLSKSHSGRVQAELHPIPKVSSPWHTIHIDATGKLSGKNDTKEYVFVMIDSFTKYTILYHTLNIDTNSAIKALKYIVSLFGAPSRVIADQGRCFASKDFKDFCSSHGISLHLIATGTSRANGQVERVMSTLKNMLTAVEVGNNKSWQDALPEVQIALNSTINRVTKSSPLELLIGKVARPLDLLTLDDDTINNNVNLAEVRLRAADAIKNSAVTEKQRFDKTKAKINRFKIDDFVLLENHERNQTKLEPKFKGPFRVVELLDGDRYLLKALNSNRTYKYAHDRVRAMPNCYVPLELNANLEVSGCADDGKSKYE